MKLSKCVKDRMPLIRNIASGLQLKLNLVILLVDVMLSLLAMDLHVAQKEQHYFER